MIRLVDTTGTIPVEVKGNTFHLKAMTNGDKARLAFRIGKTIHDQLTDDEAFDQMFDIIADQIVSIDGYVAAPKPATSGAEPFEFLPAILVDGKPMTMREFIALIEDEEIQNGLADAIYEHCSLKVTDRKN